MALAMGVGVLVLIEIILAALGVASPGTPIRKLFLRPGPVFIQKGKIFETNPEQLFFMRQSFAAKKPPRTTRIFIVGGSTAMGFPMESAFGPASLIKIGLDAADPGVGHEIVNAGGFAYAACEILEVVEEALDHEPDAIIVMTGHNEFLERRFTTWDAEGVGAAEKILAMTRTYRLLRGLFRWSRGTLGKEKVYPHVVTERERQLVAKSFEKDLTRIAQACGEKGVVMILAALPSNSFDYRPHGPSRVPWDEARTIDAELIKASGPELDEVGEGIERLKARYGNDAWLSFEAGSFYMKMDGIGEAARDEDYYSLARTSFLRARDRDPMPVRATSDLIRALRRVAERKGVFLADAEKSFQTERDKDHGAEERLFFDHCHPSPEGEVILIKSLIGAMGESGLADLKPGWDKIYEDRVNSYRSTIPDKVWAETYYRIAVETGLYMERPHRGLPYARKAAELDPAHPKASRLIKRLEADSAITPYMTGD